MRKALLIAAAALLLGTVGMTFAANYVNTVVGVAAANANASISAGRNAQSQVTVKIPTVILLRVTGSNTSGLPTVTFDFQSNLSAYQTALNATSPSPITYSSAVGTSTLTSVDVLSNTGGASVTASIGIGTTGQAMPASAVYFNGKSGGDTITKSGTGWQKVADSTSFGILPDATVAPGSYDFVVTYTAISQ